MPKGFPITSPAIIPKLFVCPKLLCQLSPTEMQVLATANNGRIKKATGLCKKYWRIYEGDFSPPLPNGIANANKTPVIVAWTPECNIKYHITTPPIKYGIKLWTFCLFNMSRKPKTPSAINKFINAIEVV